GFKNADGSDAPDDWKMSRAGLRADWKFGNGADASVISEIYDGTTRPGLTIFNDVSDEIDLIFPSKDQRGGHIIGNYQSIPNDDGSFYKFKGYYDRYENYDYRINEKRDVVDLEFRQHMQPWDHHYFIWGASYRLTHYSFSNARNIVPQANGRTDHLYNAFIQDDIALDTNLNLTLGSRFEHNPFTGFEIQPSARLAWKPKPQRTIWTAVSRAVKTPSLSETRVDTYGITLASNNSLLLNILGNETLKSEEITAFEFGFREQIHDSVRLDIAAFANRYQNILTYAGTTDECTYGSRDPNPPYLCEISGTGITEAPAELINEMKAWSYGFEFTLDWNVNEWWSLHANYSAMRLDADSIESSTPKANEWLIENLSANNTANLRSSMNLPNDWQLDLWVRYIDNLRDQEIPAHTGFDVRIGKTVGDNFELSLTGQNLFKKQRLEFNEIFSGLQESEIEQAWYFQLRLNY
ncbi:MAG: TonB-dependent receptor plug domain-containing protein, partial [Endozoicomonas sp.]